MFNIVLVQPQIPPNTGNIIRLAANTGSRLHLVEPLGFSMDDKHMRRAGLDYHEYAHTVRYKNWQDFLEITQAPLTRLFAFTTKGAKNAFDQSFLRDDYFVFGSETHGLPTSLRETFPLEQRLKLPMLASQRSLNLANSVAIVVYEAWRQINFIT